RASTATTSCASFQDARLPSYFADAPGLLAYLGRHLFRAGVALEDAERGQPRRDGRRLDCVLDRIHERLPRPIGDSRGREKAEPDAEQIVLVAELLHRRNVGEVGDPVRRDDAAERPALDLRA